MGWGDILKQPSQNTGGTAAPVGPGLQAPAAEPVARTTQPVGAPQLPPGGSSGGADWQALAQQFMQGKPSGPQTMQALVQFLQQNGIKAAVAPRGDGLSSDKIMIGDEQAVFDLLGDEGGANRLQIQPDGYIVDGRPSYTPYQWSDPNQGEMRGGGSFGGSLNGMGSGYLATPWGGSVGMPDPARMLESPSYKWNLSRGLDGLDKSHAARGTILSGGAGKDAMEFASGLASAEYDKDFNRGMQVADFNRGTYWGDTDRIFGRFNNLANTGLAAAGNFANNVSSIYQGQANANAENALNTGTNWGNLAGLGVDLLGGIFAGRGRG